MITKSDSRVWKLIPCCLWAILMLPALAEGGAFPADKRPEDIGRRLIAAYPAEEAFMMYRTDECRAIHYAEVCAAVGVVRLAALIGEDEDVVRVANRFRNVDKEGPENTRNHVDANVYGILPLELAMRTGDRAFLQEGMRFADMQWEDPLPDGMTRQTRYWIDDIYMIGSLQVQAFRASGDPVYLDRAALEIEAYLKRLQQPNGLFHHGEGIPYFWGRGNGWVAAGLAELISVLPKDHSRYAGLVSGYLRMMEALLGFQGPDGMWRQLIDYEDAWNETSCTAMFGYAMNEGVRRGLLDRARFEPAIRRAWLALCDYVDASGQITDVCVGTGQVNDVAYYLDRPTVTGDYHGQAPMLWFAASLLLDEVP